MGVHAQNVQKTLNHLSTFKNGQTLMKYTLQSKISPEVLKVLYIL